MKHAQQSFKIKCSHLRNWAIVFLSTILLTLFATTVFAGDITGKVSNSAGSGIENVNIWVFDTASSSQPIITRSDNNGNYTITVPVGTYKIQFNGFDLYNTGYLSQWYKNSATEALADAVNVTTDVTTSMNINVTLIQGSTISGTVSDSVVGVVANANVEAYDAVGGSLIGSSSSDSAGNYTIIDLPPGNYKLQFNRIDPNSNSNGYLSQWYNIKTSQADADVILVAAGATIIGKDVTLTLGGTVSGTVSDSEEETPSNINVIAYDAVGGSPIGSAPSQSDGSYMIIGLPTGSYKVQFSGNNTNYISQWYDNKTSQSLADPVAVTAGVTTSNINATMILGDAIYGMVSDSTGGGITGVNVGAYDAVNDSLIGSVLSQFDGSYTIYGLPDGSYKVKFSINGYRSQWYNNKTSQALADIVPVVNEEAAYDINATMTNNYTVSFNSNGGSTVASQSVAYNTVASTPTTPTQTGTTFVGWYSDSALTTVFVFTTPITADTTLYAKWAVLSTYTVTYNGNTNTAGTAPIDSSSYLAGATVTVLAPGSLSKTGYTFSGWNTTANGTGTNYSAGTTFVIFDNINLFAQFYNVGDCDKNGTVTIDEVQSAINMFLGLKTPALCVDTDSSNDVSIAEVQKTINSFLGL